MATKEIDKDKVLMGWFKSSFNKSSYFLMPFIGKSCKSFLWNSYINNREKKKVNFINSYIGISSEKMKIENGYIYLEYVFDPSIDIAAFERSGFYNRVFVNSDTTRRVYECRIPDIFMEDYLKFLKGDYSKFSNKAKDKIKTFFSYQNDNVVMQILLRSKSLREKLQKELHVSIIPSNIELCDKPYDRDEILKIDNVYTLK